MQKKNNINKLSEKLIVKIAKILEIKKNELVKKDSFLKIESYDSLKHLEIVIEIDKLFGKKIKMTGDLSNLTSVKKILKLINNK
jgi:acyl carrier protein